MTKVAGKRRAVQNRSMNLQLRNLSLMRSGRSKVSVKVLRDDWAIVSSTNRGGSVGLVCLFFSWKYFRSIPPTSTKSLHTARARLELGSESGHTGG